VVAVDRGGLQLSVVPVSTWIAPPVVPTQSFSVVVEQ